MAHWDHDQRRVQVKLVYWGPAQSGKTTTLEALAALGEPDGAPSLVAVRNGEGRTLLFDHLRLEVGALGEWRLALALFTVPGTVPYERARRLVLGGADAVVFVADSRPTRREQNVWSLQNLRLNLRALGAAEALPVIFQANKQDRSDAAPPAAVAAWLGLDAALLFPSTASQRRGVVEPLGAALRRTLVGPELAGIDSGREVTRLLAPWTARAERPPTGNEPAAATAAVVPGSDDALEAALCASLTLAELLCARSRPLGAGTHVQPQAKEERWPIRSR